MQAANYQRHVDCVDHQEGPHYAGHGDGWTAANSGGQRERCHREVHFAFLPEKYKPLVDEEARVKAKEERKKKKKKEQYKIVKKVGQTICSKIVFNMATFIQLFKLLIRVTLSLL